VDIMNSEQRLQRDDSGFSSRQVKNFQLKVISAKRLKRTRKWSFALSRVQRRAVL